MNRRYDNFFMGQPNFVPRMPINNVGEMNFRLNNHPYRILRPRLPPPQLRSLHMNCHDFRQRQAYGSHFRQGYEKKWVPFGSKGRFSSPSRQSLSTPTICNVREAKSSYSEFRDGKQCVPILPIPNQEIYPSKYMQPHSRLRRNLDKEKENSCRPISCNFNTEVHPSGIHPIGTRNDSQTQHQTFQAIEHDENASLPTNLNITTPKMTPVVNVAVESSADDTSESDSSDSIVAVGSQPGSSDSENALNTLNMTRKGSHTSLDEISAPQEEEYEPENPDINALYSLKSLNQPKPEISAAVPVDCRHMAVCDNEGFHEAFVGVCIRRYPFGLGRLIEVAGYGVWFADGHKGNFSGVLKPERPQNTKAIMIHGSARTIENMKKDGYTKIRINLETEYLNENVLHWISKYMENSNASPSNWDEVKYHEEIVELCNSATGMIIKWSHCCDVSVKKNGIQKAKQLAKEAANIWMKAHRLRQEAVGTSQ